MIKVVAVVGPTAVGKSDFAVKYALENTGEIISADSRQVYKGLDLGTGKITYEEMLGIPHHMLDVSDPKDIFSVEKYRDMASKKINEINERGNLPIICGGTGYYIDALLFDIQYPDTIKNSQLRENLEQKNSEEVYSILLKEESEFAKNLNNSEKNNKRRLIRYIEISRALGYIPKIEKKSVYEIEWIVLDIEDMTLRENINKRIQKRIEQGMIEEILGLHDKGLSYERMEELGLEYRYISRYVRGILSKDEMIVMLQNKIWQYAKRQRLWFRKYGGG